MKYLKIIIIMIFLISAVFVFSSCVYIASRYITPRYNITLRYNGSYTGIDTLINVDGYFTVPGSNYVIDKFSFYRDGTLEMGFTSKKILRCYENGTDGFRKFNKDKFFLPFENDSIVIGSRFNPGLYKIQNDTIIAQAVYRESDFRTKIFYINFEILSKDKLRIINFEILSKDKLRIIKFECVDVECSYCDKYVNQELHFYPAWRPDSTDNWLRDCLREKGAK